MNSQNMIWKIRDGVITESNEHNLVSFLDNNVIIGCDTETTGFNPHTNNLLCIQFGNKDIQFVIDCSKYGITILKDLIEKESKTFIFHNAKFDLQWLLKYNIRPKKIYDTFLAECILTTGLDKEDKGLGLKDVGLKYCNVELDKSIRGQIHRVGLTDDVIRYAATDTKYLENIMIAQEKLIAANNLSKVRDLEFDTVKVLVRMEYEGILLDTQKWLGISEITEAEVKKSEAILDNLICQSNNPKLKKYVNNQTNLFGFEEKTTSINWASPHQKKLILNAFGIKVDDVSDKTLQKLKKVTPIAGELINLSKNNKLSTSFGKDFLKFVNPVTKRVHANHWQILSTGRMSMEEPNLQQIPSHGKLAEEIKACFIAKEGYKIVSTDVSGFELRIIAEYSQDPTWLKVFNNGEDLHSVLCAMTFNIPIEDVKKPFPFKPDLNYRFVQKTINFGLSYGMSEYKLGDMLQIEPKAAKKIIDKFFALVPKVQQFLNKCEQTAQISGKIITDPYYRRIRWFSGYDSGDNKKNGEIGRAAKNTIPQGTNASLIKQCLVNLQNLIDEKNYPVKILLTIHDEIVCECREDFAEEWKEIQESVMKETIKTIIKSIPVEVESVIDSHWRK